MISARSQCIRGRGGLVLAVALLSVSGFCALGRNARAAEYVLPITPPGATDIDQAILPPFPGFYGGVAVLPMVTNFGATYNTAGQREPASESINLSVPTFAAALLYVYPFKPWGWTIASSFVQPLLDLHYSIGDGYGPSGSEFALGDAYSDLFVASKNVGLFGAIPGNLHIPYGLNLAFGLALIVPDGGYEANEPISTGGNVWAPDPNIAVTWNSGPRFSFFDNTQLSAKVYYAFPTRNTILDYQTGEIFDIDMSATEQLGGFRFGVTGSYQTQVTADSPGNGLPQADGNRYTEALAGPIAEYAFPSGVFLKAKYEYTFAHVNTVGQQLVVLSVGFPF